MARTHDSAATSRRRRLPLRLAAAAGAAVLAVTGLASASALPTTGSQGAKAAQNTSAAQNTTTGSHDVLANLWEWNWPSVAKECTDVLGPSGYAGVQVAPPADSLSRLAPDAETPGVRHPWWEVYQPASYQLTSRMGTPAQFKQMVKTCRRAGVKVYVDAVINHMTGQGEISYGGVSYEKYRYPGLYGPENFHASSGDCPSPSGGIENFNDPQQVFRCELVGLSDLRTDTPYVRRQVARYLNRLIGYGVSGFRVDAAKHVGQEDLIAIQSLLHRTWDGEKPFFALEVFPGGPGVLTPQAFERAGTPLGFDFAYQVKNAFKSYNTPSTGAISALKVFGEDAGLLPSDDTLVFVQNHDTERGSDTLSYKDGKTNVIAHQFMLAYGYGRPQVYSAFAFTNTYDSPPADADGFITDTDCSKGWVCVDRDRAVTNLVGFHNIVGDAPVRNWYDDGANLIAFSRGNRGWIAINNADTAATRTFRTGLKAGTYCDISHATFADGDCSGPTVRVNSRGRATVTVPAKEAVAFDRSTLVRS
jgi:alpha-amylase